MACSASRVAQPDMNCVQSAQRRMYAYVDILCLMVPAPLIMALGMFLPCGMSIHGAQLAFAVPNQAD
jgi:hypothetical protein